MSDDPLDQINRFVVVLLALIGAFAALVAILLAWGAPSGTIEWIEDYAGWLRDHDHNEAKLILTLGAVVIALLMAMVIIVEITPSPTQRMRVRAVRAGDASLTTRQIAERIEAEAEQVEHVGACEAIVAARGKRVEVVLDLHVDAGADLARTADEACRRADRIVTREMGIEMARPPRARMHYRELRLREDTGAPQSAPAEVQHPPTGWERPRTPEEERDQRPGSDAPEEAQA